MKPFMSKNKLIAEKVNIDGYHLQPTNGAKMYVLWRIETKEEGFHQIFKAENLKEAVQFAEFIIKENESK